MTSPVDETMPKRQWKGRDDVAPRPWTANRRLFVNGSYGFQIPGGVTTAEANLIVKAVNDYDRLRAIEAAARVLADAVDEGFDGWAARIPNPGQRRRIVQAADALRESFR